MNAALDNSNLSELNHFPFELFYFSGVISTWVMFVQIT